MPLNEGGGAKPVSQVASRIYNSKLVKLQAKEIERLKTEKRYLTNRFNPIHNSLQEIWKSIANLIPEGFTYSVTLRPDGYVSINCRRKGREDTPIVAQVGDLHLSIAMALLESVDWSKEMHRNRRLGTRRNLTISQRNKQYE